MPARANAKGRSKAATSEGKLAAVDPSAPKTRRRTAAQGQDQSSEQPVGKTSGKASSASNEATIAGLKAELTAARARIAQLEQRQAEILNRIDWVIDSLENLPSD